MMYLWMKYQQNWNIKLVKIGVEGAASKYRKIMVSMELVWAVDRVRSITIRKYNARFLYINATVVLTNNTSTTNLN